MGLLRRLRHFVVVARELHFGRAAETPAVTLRALLDGLASRAPGLDVDLHELTSAEQRRMLTEGRLDVGLLHHPVETAGLRTGPPVDVPLGVLLPRTSPLVRAREVDLAGLAGLDLVTAPPATAPGWHEHLLAVCRRQGFVPTRVRHARNPEFLFGLLLAGGAVAVEPEAVARREPRLAWRPIVGTPLIKRTSAAWPDRSPHPAAPMFGQLAAEVLAVDEPAPAPAIAPAARPWPVLFEADQTPTG
ncbi:LysR family substrate-binding domain-containing protein [Micromonospora sp. NPDC006766]|uniref:LysR family substrate-binding domain-containing protein n=1 Tax=Micromonospora sp. NPDC006766 TaxID=3154778 RepID=UPI0033E1573D